MRYEFNFECLPEALNDLKSTLRYLKSCNFLEESRPDEQTLFPNMVLNTSNVNLGTLRRVSSITYFTYIYKYFLEHVLHQSFLITFAVLLQIIADFCILRLQLRHVRVFFSSMSPLLALQLMEINDFLTAAKNSLGDGRFALFPWF